MLLGDIRLVAGIRQIDRTRVQAGKVYGLRGVSLAREMLLAASLPPLPTDPRLGPAQGGFVLVAAKLIGASRGLGVLPTDGQNTGRAAIIVRGIVPRALCRRSAGAAREGHGLAAPAGRAPPAAPDRPPTAAEPDRLAAP